ncbi:FtsX-like permease family protein [Algoriphagus sp. NBT04N3]|jgi:putative ABC transport system permease protein|uniref:ABC transporter permease n=1 Tax=Algoriphagus sp. NBT04N3 TaxID=2705473 RepID=UPI001C635643|nr:ABC transporter permease [Algoriphagus sp. NBT04N3]QYH39040.1 FtsX-like permease family protein [Algoriphagus sp. NBT04N3]
MFKNYLKIAFRGFGKHKLTFFINLFGLTLGLCAAILIGLWIKSELETDRRLPGSDQVFRVMEHQNYGDQVFTIPSTPGVLAEAMKENLAEVQYAATYTWNEENLFVQGDKRVKLSGIYAGADYLKIFQYPLLFGNREQLLSDKSHIVLTESSAIKLFGKTDVLDEEIEMISTDGTELFLVKGVIADEGMINWEKFDFILPYKLFFDKPYNSWLQHWGNNGPNTVITLQENADPEAFSASIKDFIRDRFEGSNADLFVFPQSDMYLHGSWKDGIIQEGRIKTVKLFAMIGFFILVIACINFMNLSTAKSQKRSKEVGVRKVSGADKSSLIYQFLSESLLITFFSGLFALVLVQLTLPVFNQLAGKELVLPVLDLYFWVGFLLVLVFTGLLAGSYPAFYLSSTKVVSVFKNQFNGNRKVAFARKGLVLFQFVLATCLLISTVVIFQQINYALNQDLGYEKDQLILVPLEGELPEKYEIFKSRLEARPGISSVSRASHNMMGRSNNTGDVSWEGKEPGFNALFERFRVDYDFLETLGIELLSGKDFSKDRISDSISAVIVNEKAYELITQNNPENSSLDINGSRYEIIGVAKNFHFQSMHQSMEPAFMVIDPAFNFNSFIRINSSSMQEALAEIEGVFAELNPVFPFTYQFMDENYARMYREDVRLRDLAKYFSLLTILISCLGLLGLSAHVAEQKTKEIGIRKVLGASTFSILNVINKEFITIVSISILFGSGLGYWIMQDWLSGYAYRINFEWWFIPAVAGIIFLIALSTVWIQSYKAANSNPVQAIKTE